MVGEYVPERGRPIPATVRVLRHAAGGAKITRQGRRANQQRCNGAGRCWETCRAARVVSRPRGECDMRVPQVSERIKEAPAQALRGVFAGIGQLLLITDKLRNKTPQDVPRARKPEASEKATATSPAGQRGQTAAAPAEPAAAEPVASAPATGEAVTSDAAVTADAAVAADAAAADAAVAAEPPAKADAAKADAAKADAAKPAPAGPAGAEPPKPPKRQSPRDFDKTGNVRLIGEEEGGSALSATTPPSPAAPAGAAESATAPDPVIVPDPVTAPDPVTVPDPVTGPDPVTAPDPVTVPDPVTAPDTAPDSATVEPAGSSADSAPPLPNYDELSVASLRARLRNLDVAQVKKLADYERAHAARADVMAMFERRIVKLEAEA